MATISPHSCFQLNSIRSSSHYPSRLFISPLISHPGSNTRPSVTRRVGPLRTNNGKTRASLAGLDGNTSDVLGPIGIFRATGEKVQFNDLWDQNEGMAVVALLRHFGCPCCWELASVLKDSIPTLDSAGVKLIAVGVGTPDKARILANRLPFPMDCLYADPSREAYHALDLYYGLSRTFFNPASAKVFSRWDSLREAVKNYTISATPEDSSSVLQQGGMFVFKGMQLLYARKDEGTGDHAPLDEVLNICCRPSVA
ncbi:thioredoxin-like protein AAED1, chloroplastic isoform X1 [Amborella trichopoda]|nr:thioredoxin-like protein AAED1, chloroplastic isoform X1 [Amborella trichopoda]|eukprot:XP_011628018.1 thioredoxin-like protein AAED1, chloroplastic isoform X1 [Amborella trichopoda]